VLVIDKRVEYVFSFDFCFANATLVDQKVTLYVHIANAAAIIFDSFLTKSVIVPANAVQSTCGRLVARIPHYELFPHVGINGFAVRSRMPVTSACTWTMCWCRRCP
jgi:hypothetical protein